MSNILVINSSPTGDQSVTRRLTQNLLDRLQVQGDTTVTIRDLAETPVPHLDGATLGAFMTPAADRTPDQARAAGRSDDLIAELQAADVVVIGAPMHNFGIPSGLKAWIDHVARAGITFRYTETGPQGLLSGKTAYVLASRGGIYAEGTPGAALDFVTPYLKSVLGFIGITDVRTVAAEGLAMGEDAAQAALAQAEAAIDQALAA